MNVFAIRDNLILSDFDTAISEVKEFKKYGGNTIVDQTNRFMGRDPLALKKISRITGLNIITSTGYYLEYTHPSYVSKKSEEQIAEIMIDEIVNGIDDTGVRAGVIGEIGTNRIISESEKKVLRASGIAQIETNASLFVHTWAWGENGTEVLDILEKVGANLGKTVICHVDGKINLKYYKEIIDRGATIAFDDFGTEYIQFDSNEILIHASDIEKIDAIKKLINFDEKYLSKIIITSDICVKSELKKFGGYGYAHILKNIVPLMKKFGFINSQINYLISENPRRLISINS